MEHVLALLQRIPVMTGLTQRGREPVARVQPVVILPAADRVERIGDPARYVQRFLVKAQVAQVARYRIKGIEGEKVVATQNPAAVFEVTLVDVQCLPEPAEPP